MNNNYKQTWTLPKDPKYYEKKVAYINARVIDPASKTDIIGYVLTKGSFIEDFGPAKPSYDFGLDVEIIDCKNNILTPGLIDIQVHFREPGFIHKETLETGSKSAASGGITTVVCQPNTNPVIDSEIIVEYIKSKARENGYINIKCYGAITKNMEGENLSDMSKLVQAGVVGFTDDGLPVMNSLLMSRAFSYSKMLNVPIVQHAEDLNLSQGGCINEGKTSYELGVVGIPNISEAVIVARDLLILEHTGGHYHVLHVSTKEALELIRNAKNKGLNVTCEAAPHHFLLTDQAVLEHGTCAKMNPPLRSEADRSAIEQGLIDGTIDAIATDHAPHDQDSKNQSLSKASFGIVGVETMLPLSLELYHSGKMKLIDLLSLMTNKPADIINIEAGRIEKGKPADLVLIDLNHEWIIDINKFSSKSNNSPFDGRKVKGRAIRTIVSGQTVYKLEDYE